MSPKSQKGILSYAAIVLIIFGFLITKARSQSLATGAGIPIVGRQSSPSVTWTIYLQPPSLAGGLIPSSWWTPNGSASDRYVWDNFTLQSSKDITEVHWVGGYNPASLGSGGPVLDFTVSIFPTTASGTQPDITAPLVSYQVGGNAGQTPTGTIGEVALYNYAFILPVPFTATAGTKYWVEIYAWQNGIPDWSLANGTGGDGVYFFRIHGDGDIYQIRPGDAAFSLLGPVNLKFNYLPMIIR